MTKTIRSPGQHKFWVVQHRDPERWDIDWADVGSHQIAKVPASLRHGPTYGSPDQEPFREWSACGNVWQATGNNGFEDASDAVEMMELLMEHCSHLQFRAVLVELKMRYTKVVTLGEPGEQARKVRPDGARGLAQEAL